MSKGHRGILAGIGIIAFVVSLVGYGGYALQPKLLPYENGSPPDLTGCHYADAKQAADDAQAARDKLGKSASKSLIEDASRKLEAARQQKANAEACERAEHDDSDLAAQWTSAKAAQNTVILAGQLYWWGVVEIGVVALALLAAGWAAWETRKANTIALQAFYEGGASISIEKATMAFSKEKLVSCSSPSSMLARSAPSCFLSLARLN